MRRGGWTTGPASLGVKLTCGSGHGVFAVKRVHTQKHALLYRLGFRSSLPSADPFSFVFIWEGMELLALLRFGVKLTCGSGHGVFAVKRVQTQKRTIPNVQV